MTRPDIEEAYESLPNDKAVLRRVGPVMGARVLKAEVEGCGSNPKPDMMRMPQPCPSKKSCSRPLATIVLSGLDSGQTHRSAR